MQDLARAYFVDAWPVAMTHGSLLIIAVYQLLQIWHAAVAEQETLATLETSRQLTLRAAVAGPSYMVEVARHVGALASKGRVIDPDGLSRTLSRLFAHRQSVVRFCVNGLIVVGLMGTLYNLWLFGPQFWRSLGDPNLSDDTMGIGIAFAASLCGIGLALLVSLFEVVFVRPRVDRLTQRGAAILSQLAVERLPATQDVLLQQAVTDFAARAETIVASASQENARLTRELVGSLQEVTSTLDRHGRELGEQWQSFFGQISRRIDEGADRVILTTSQLAGATEQAAGALVGVTRTLEGYQELSELVVLVKKQSIEMVTKVAAKLDSFSNEARSAFSEVSKQHAESLRSESDDANRRLADLVDLWHSKSAQTLTGFQNEMRSATEGLGQEWKRVVSSFGTEGDRILTGWSHTLALGAADARTTMTDLGQQVERVDGALRSMAAAGDAVAQSVDNLQSSLAAMQESIERYRPGAAAPSSSHNQGWEPENLRGRKMAVKDESSRSTLSRADVIAPLPATTPPPQTVASSVHQSGEQLPPTVMRGNPPSSSAGPAGSLGYSAPTATPSPTPPMPSSRSQVVATARRGFFSRLINGWRQ